MKKKRPKFLPIKKDALMTLQFWKDDNTLMFMSTINDGDLVDTGFVNLDYARFGKKFAGLPNLSYEEKKGFAEFCEAFIKNYKEGYFKP